MNKFEEDFLKLTESLFKLSDEEHKEIIKAYKGSIDNILPLLAQLYIKYAVDGKLTIAELHKYNRLLSFEQQIIEELKQLRAIEVKQFNTMLSGIYSQAFYQTAYTLEMGTAAAISFTLLKPEFVKEAISFNWSGVPFSERIWANQDAMLKGLRTELTQGIIQGDSVDKMARRFRKKFNSSYHNTQRLFRTESARVINSAQEKIYSDSGVVQKVKWLATLEGNTCSECAKLDQKVFNLDDSRKPSVPRHPNCICCTVAVIEGMEHKKRKDNATKEIISNMSYKEWEKEKGI